MSQQRVSRQQQRYAMYERCLTWALLADAVLFGLFLLFSGLGIVWLKVVTAVAAILLGLFCLVSLYLTGEFLRRRSRYLTAGFCAVVLCVVVSLVCRYPAPAEIRETAAVFTGLLTI